MKWLIAFFIVVIGLCFFIDKITERLTVSLGGTEIIPCKGAGYPEKMYFYNSLDEEIQEVDCLEGKALASCPLSDIIIGLNQRTAVFYHYYHYDSAATLKGSQRLSARDIDSLPPPLRKIVRRYLP